MYNVIHVNLNNMLKFKFYYSKWGGWGGNNLNFFLLYFSFFWLNLQKKNSNLIKQEEFFCFLIFFSKRKFEIYFENCFQLGNIKPLFNCQFIQKFVACVVK